ncbi:phosphonate C-P lyase system protein PhnH [Loktanella agnita]|uniref:phosphonate C-P lyase system protein PhnH n=1 Tax=Loktanella agnita TaxID=287097 RepID=UPI0039876E56
MQTQTLSGGFSTPATDAAHAFRAVMDAMARPGTIQQITGATPPAPLSAAAGAVLLTLCDTDTGLTLSGDHNSPAIRDWLAFHTGAPLVAPAQADFALGRWDTLQPLSAYPIGTADYPDRSTTLIIEVGALTNDGPTLTGPGIKDSATLSLPETTFFQANHAQFPLGLDCIFTCDNRLAALPRSTKVN